MNSPTLKPFLVSFDPALAHGPDIGVTASSTDDALEIVFGDMFHHQTIPGSYEIRPLRAWGFIRLAGRVIPPWRWHKADIWHPQGYERS
ncbi:MAG: hypothetical protein D6722_28685 [Bacteroidetes bacterium]|nr:MAG: hypothetical protein D6722_28685 [Bacteroidota bacterium]